MYTCNNCGGSLRFDVVSQQLICTKCSTLIDPYAVEGEQTAEKELQYETMEYTCPQCGARLLSEDTEAVAFCSYCGETSMLAGKLTKAERPKYIIPFSKTKEECKKAYAKMMRGAVYTPKELRNPEFIDGFRGIYIPYWYYGFEQKGRLHISGYTTEYSGDYMYTHQYDLNADIDADYDGLSYDASSAFLDNMSQQIAPYDLAGMKEFTPAYLSGFYADTADVPAEVYRDEAKKIVVEDISNRIKNEQTFEGFSKEGMEAVVEHNTVCSHSERVMFPVWFLSYRNKGRVLYTAVNGQTGKMAADLPVDMKKYLLGTVILAVPLFFLLNMLPVVSPVYFLMIIIAIASVVVLLFYSELCKIDVRDRNSDDLGLQNKQSPQREGRRKRYYDPEYEYESQKKPTKKNSKMQLQSFFMVLGILVLIGIPIANESGVLNGFATMLFSVLDVLMLFVSSMVSGVKTIKKQRGLSVVKGFGYITIWIAQMISLFVIWQQPAYDVWYYGAAMITMAAIATSLIDLIKAYNILASRKLPQFNRVGGDDNA